MNALSEIIIEARKKAGLSQSELARRLNLTPQSVQAWESGRSTPRANMLADIAAALDTSKVGLFTAMLQTISGPVLSKGAEYLEAQATKAANLESLIDRTARLDQQLDALAGSHDATGYPSDEGGAATRKRAIENLVPAPFLNEVEIVAGSGRTTIEVDLDHTMLLEASMLREQGVKFEKAACAVVHGDSMAPMLPDGCIIAVDTDCTAVRDGKTYAVDQNGQLRVRTLSRIPGGGVRFRSFNRDEYPDEEYSLDALEAGRISIIGRVFWSSMVW